MKFINFILCISSVFGFLYVIKNKFIIFKYEWKSAGNNQVSKLDWKYIIIKGR